MTRYLVAVLLAVVLATGGVGTLFWIQNSSRSTQLSLDLWFAAWQLAEPVSIPALMAWSFAAGLLLGVVLFALPGQRNARKVRQLQARLGPEPEADAEGWKGSAAGDL